MVWEGRGEIVGRREDERKRERKESAEREERGGEREGKEGREKERFHCILYTIHSTYKVWLAINNEGLFANYKEECAKLAR